MTRRFSRISATPRSRIRSLFTGTVASVGLASCIAVIGASNWAAAATPAGSSGAAPTVTSVAPDFGSTSGGTAVTIRGDGVGHATEVLFGAQSAESILINSWSSITAISPVESAGTVAIRVVTGSGTTPRNPSDQFTFVDQPPGTVTIVPQNVNASCQGDSDTITWVPPSDTAGLLGFQVVLEQVTDEGPQIFTYDESADQQSQGFTVVNGQNNVLVYAMTGSGVAQSPFGQAQLTGYGIPLEMQWNDAGANAVADGSATVAFEWPGPPQNSTTGGDIAADTVEITQEPGGLNQDVPASISGVTSTFGDLTDGSQYTYTDTVSNLCGTSDVSQASPGFTPGVLATISGAPPAGLIGAPYDFTFTVGGDPTPTETVTQGQLPSGLTLEPDGEVTGTPTESGDFPLTVTATNGVGIEFFSSGSESETVTLEVDQAPSITSAASANFGAGKPVTFEVTTAGFPAPSIVEAGALPPGLTFDVQSGGTAEISGTAQESTNGVYPITITASNGVGSAAVQDFTLTVGPAITSSAFVTGAAGSPFAFSITTVGKAFKSISERGSLPRGLHFSVGAHGTAVISGTPGGQTGGSYPITLVAIFGSGSSERKVIQHLTLVIDQPLGFTSPQSATAATGTPFSFTISTVGYPGATSIAAQGSLPTWLSLTYDGGNTATLSGNAPSGTEGDYSIDIVASNSVGSTAQQTLVLTVAD